MTLTDDEARLMAMRSDPPRTALDYYLLLSGRYFRNIANEPERRITFIDRETLSDTFLRAEYTIPSVDAGAFWITIRLFGNKDNPLIAISHRSGNKRLFAAKEGGPQRLWSIHLNRPELWRYRGGAFSEGGAFLRVPDSVMPELSVERILHRYRNHYKAHLNKPTQKKSIYLIIELPAEGNRVQVTGRENFMDPSERYVWAEFRYKGEKFEPLRNSEQDGANQPAASPEPGSKWIFKPSPMTSSYPLSDEQKASFAQNGYLRLEDAVPTDTLKYWQNLAGRLEIEAAEAHEQGRQLHQACVVEDPVGPRLMRYNDILGIDADACLDLLACPAMIAVARELSGRGTVPLQMDILYKQQHPHPVIKWHQGAPHPRGFPYLNVGIYLDDAPAGDGCLRYVSGTQHELVDIEALSRDHGWDIPGVVELPAKAGDILIQDMMILHGSQPKRSPGVRRTVYVELRPFAGILETGDQSEGWAVLRQKWMRLVLEKCGEGEWPEEWMGDYPAVPEGKDEVVAAIFREPEPPTPAVWGVNSIETDEYPVPSDMREWGEAERECGESNA